MGLYENDNRVSMHQRSETGVAITTQITLAYGFNTRNRYLFYMTMIVLVAWCRQYLN